MQVRLRIQFKPPVEDDWRAMRSLANSLTNDPDAVRVFADTDPEWLVVEFTMPTEAQYKALPKLEWAIKLYAWRRQDVRFSFPDTEAERARAGAPAARPAATRRRRRTTSRKRKRRGKVHRRLRFRLVRRRENEPEA